MTNPQAATRQVITQKVQSSGGSVVAHDPRSDKEPVIMHIRYDHRVKYEQSVLIFPDGSVL